MADHLVTVLGTLDRVEAARIEALLRARGIEVLLADSGQAAVVHGAAGFRFPVELRVPAEQAAEAERMVAEDLAAQAEESPGSWSESDAGPAGEEPAVPEPSLERSRDPVLAPLLGLTALHLTLLVLAGDMAGRQRLVDFGALRGWPAPREAYRLVTYAFLHAGFEHLAWNTVSLFLFGWGAIRLFGLARSAFAYALGAVASGLASGWLIPEGVVVGSSGAIFALVAMVLVGDWRLAARSARPRQKLLRLAGVALLLLPGVFSHNILAHMAGVGAGALLGRLYDVSSATVKEDRLSRLLGWTGVAILVLPWVWALPALMARFR